MLITIYDKINLIESHNWDGNLIDFIKAQAGDNYNETVQPFSVRHNGEIVKDWHHISDGDVDITLEPQGTAVIVAIVVALIAAAYAYYVTRNLDDYSSPDQPNSIYESNIRANRVRLNQLIREVAGTIPIFPDYAAAPRKVYENNIEYIYNLLCVGVGYFDITPANIYIADTPIASYGSDVEVEIFEPGQDVSGNNARYGYYQARDLAGLRLVSAFDQPSGDWEAVFIDPDMIQWFLGGVATPFPFDVDAIIQIIDANTAANERFLRIDAISTTTVSDDTTAVTVLNPETVIIGYDVVDDGEGGIISSTPITQVIYVDTTDTLTTDTQASVVWGAVSGGVNWEGPFTIMPAGQTTDSLEIDVRFPRGLGRLNNNGSFSSRTVEIEIQYRDSAIGGAWTTVAGTSYTNNTNDTLAYSVTQSIPNYNPEVRFRRVTADFTSTSETGEVEIQRVKGRLASPTSYPDTTMIAMKVRSTDALARTAENQISIVGASRKLPTIAEIQNKAQNNVDWDLRSSVTQTTDNYSVESIKFVSSEEFTDANSQYDGFFFADNGSNFYLQRQVSGGNRFLAQYFLSTAYDVSTATEFSHITTVTASTSGGNFVQMYDGGTKILYCPTSSFVEFFDLTTPYDLSTIQPANTSNRYNDVGSGTTRWGFVLGDKLYRLMFGNVIREYDLSIPNDITSATYNSVEIDFDSLGTVVEFVVTETKLILFTEDIVTRTAHQFSKSATTIAGATNDNISYQFQPNELSFAFTGQGRFSCAVLGSQDVRTYSSIDVVDSRATNDVGRFAAYMLYDLLGSDIFDFVDWSALESLDTLLSARGDELNAEFANESTAYEALKLIFSAGYAEPTVKDGLLTPVRIAAGTDYSHIYTPDIMLGLGVERSKNHDVTEEPDGIIVEYLDANTGITETVQCALTGDQFIRPRSIQAFGITDRTRAWRFGMRERLRFRYKPEDIKFSTEMDGLNSYYGDSIGVVDELDAPQYGKVTQVSGSVVTTDQELTFSGGEIAFFRDDEGVAHGPFSVSAGTNSNQLNLDSPSSLGFALGDYDVLFTMGTSDQVITRAIVRSVQINADKTCDIICEEYIAEIYANDDGSPP